MEDGIAEIVDVEYVCCQTPLGVEIEDANGTVRVDFDKVPVSVRFPIVVCNCVVTPTTDTHELDYRCMMLDPCPNCGSRHILLGDKDDIAEWANITVEDLEERLET